MCLVYHRTVTCWCRWEVIATFINSHSAEGSKTKTAKQVVPSCGVLLAASLMLTLQVINKVKALKKLESSQRETENSQAFQSFQQKHSSRATTEAAPTERYGMQHVMVVYIVCELCSNHADKVLWTTDEQKVTYLVLAQVSL